MKKTNNIILLIASFFGLLYITKKAEKKIVKMATDIKKEDFILSILPIEKEIGAKIGVPYQFLLAQISLETNFGKSSLWQKYFNPGGIKAKKGQDFVSLPTKEFINGSMVTVNQNFAKYPDKKTGLYEHSKILQNKYFGKYANQTNNPNTYVRLLQGGTPKYATDPNYVKKIDNLLIEINKILLTK